MQRDTGARCCVFFMSQLAGAVWNLSPAAMALWKQQESRSKWSASVWWRLLNSQQVTDYVDADLLFERSFRVIIINNAVCFVHLLSAYLLSLSCINFFLEISGNYIIERTPANPQKPWHTVFPKMQIFFDR